MSMDIDILLQTALMVVEEGSCHESEFCTRTDMKHLYVSFGIAHYGGHKSSRNSSVAHG